MFGLCRVVTEEDEVNLFGLCRTPRNEGRITKPLLTSIRHLQSDKWSVTAFLMTYSYNVKNCHILPQERLFLHREDIFTLRTIRKEARLSLPKIPYDPQKGGNSSHANCVQSYKHISKNRTIATTIMS